MRSKKNNQENIPLKKIRSGVLGRGLSLLNMTVSSGARFASLKASELFLPEEEQKKRRTDFMRHEAERLVREIGALKGGLMKAGQLLSIYGEHFLPPEINNILKALQSDSTPLAWENMSATLERQIGAKALQNLDINTTPLAAASMGQVYQARERSGGRLLALKIQYPHVHQAINSDLKALRSLLKLGQFIPDSGGFDEIFQEVRMMLHHEADYLREADMLETFAGFLKEDSRFVIPSPVRSYCSRKVLGMSLEEGFPPDGPEVAALSQLRRNKIGMAVLELLFREIFVWRMVQTDPHFGNYRVFIGNAEDGSEDKIILYDYGAVRRLPLRYVRPFARLVKGALKEDKQSCIQAGIKLGFLRAEDEPKSQELFATICITAAEVFREEYAGPESNGDQEGNNPYPWGKTDVINKLSALAKDAVFTFRLRPPPREAIFLDRKMLGLYFFLARLEVRAGPRRLLETYLEQALSG